MKFFFARIFPWPFLLCGLFVLYHGSGQFISARKSVDWPKAKGTVFVSQMDNKSDSDGTTFHAQVAYSYVVAGVKFSSNKVAYGDYGSSDPDHAQEILNRYPINAVVEVSYRPDRPSESVLEVGVKTQAFFMPIFGLVFATVGGLMLVFLPRAMQKSSTDNSGASPLHV